MHTGHITTIYDGVSGGVNKVLLVTLKGAGRVRWVGATSMSRIDDLIAEHCPDGVEFVPLSSISLLKRGTAISRKQIFPGDVPVVAGSGAYAGFVSWWEIPIFVSDAFSIQPFPDKVQPRFCYHWLKSQQKELHTMKRGGGVPHVYAKDVAKLRIPVPPLVVQEEIVRILDTFTKLEAELEARKKQYEYYRARAFVFSDSNDVRWSTLGKISTRVSSGATPKAGAPEYYSGGTIPWLRTGEVTFGEIWDTDVKITDRAVQDTGASWITKNCVIVAISGATAARSAINKIPLTTNQHCCNLQIDEAQADYRYVFFWVSSKYQELKALGRGARSDLSAQLIKGFPIPLPPLDEQRRIVSILDKFDALVNDLSIGLPAELAARRKQYEYYRDKLLTFKEPPT